ncbi:hypothetical protein BMT54_06875 [Pasteurellaceae bacterium 15-036681]|nr:hypothetical protein BMT54_06875 [Pasteurellaceae bacterium 15-036681]
MKKITTLFSIMLSAFLLSGCLDADLPKCGDKEAKTTLSDIINDVFKGDSIKFIEAKNFKEKGFNKDKEIRVCTADVMLSNGEEEEITYNIYWDNKKKSMFMVEILE